MIRLSAYSTGVLAADCVSPINKQFKDYNSDNLDGVKIFLQEDEWVLVLPDPDRPRFQIFVEAGSDQLVNDLADKYTHIVQSLQE